MSATTFLNGRVTLHGGDCLDVLKTLPDASVDSVCTDPPYHLTSIVKRFGGKNAAPAKTKQTGAFARSSKGFMGKTWDGGDIAFQVELWAEVLRVLKPGGHLAAFSGTRTQHRMVCAIEDAGFEIRDQLAWTYGTGFPKSHDVSKAIDKAAGATREFVGLSPHAANRCADIGFGGGIEGEGRRVLTAPATEAACQWQGWGSALKPAWEPICLARKPLDGTIAQNVLMHGVGALNIGGCCIPAADAQLAAKYASVQKAGSRENSVYGRDARDRAGASPRPGGRFPANILHDGSPDVMAAFPSAAGGHDSRVGIEPGRRDGGFVDTGAARGSNVPNGALYADRGSAARFFASFPTKADTTCHGQDRTPESSIARASDVGPCFDLQSRAAVSALALAVGQSTPGSALIEASFQATSTIVTATELRLISASVTETIQSIARRFSLGLPLEKLTLSHSPVECVADPTPTDTTTITISLSKSNGSAGRVTFSITRLSAAVGVPDYGARRLHYTAKADADDRIGSKHPTVKPVDLMQWLVRLVTPKGGVVLDLFAGTGTTGEAAFREGCRAVLIEREEEYRADIARRMELAMAGPDERKRKIAAVKAQPDFSGTMFAEAAE